MSQQQPPNPNTVTMPVLCNTIDLPHPTTNQLPNHHWGFCEGNLVIGAIITLEPCLKRASLPRRRSAATALQSLVDAINRRAGRATIVRLLRQVVDFLICFCHRAQAPRIVEEWFERIEEEPWGAYLRDTNGNADVMVHGQPATIVINNIVSSARDGRLTWISMLAKMAPYAACAWRWYNSSP